MVLYHDYMKLLTKLSSTAMVAAMAVSMLSVAVPGGYVLAADDGGTKCGDTATFFDWGCGSGDNEILSVLGTVLNWLAVGVGVAVLIGIIVGAVMYATAGGNEAQAKNALGYIRNAIIALILYFGMYAIIQYLIPGGVFG